MRHPYAMRVVLGLVTSVVGSTHWRWSRLGCTRGVWAVHVAFGLYTWRLGPTRCRWVVHVVVGCRLVVTLFVTSLDVLPRRCTLCWAKDWSVGDREGRRAKTSHDKSRGPFS